MNDDRGYELAVADWLALGSDRTPKPALDAVLLAIKTTPQERDLRIPRRFTLMTSTMRLAAGVAIVAVLGVAGFAYLNANPGVGQGPTPTPSPTLAPTPTPTPSSTAGSVVIDGWVAYTSERYGLSLRHPADWVVTAAARDWSLPADADWQSPAAEQFVGPDLRVSAWSVPVDPGVSAAAWIEAYCPASTAPCTGIADRAEPATLAGHPGVLVPFTTDHQAFFLIDERMYVIASWRPGYQGYLEAVLSTVTLLPGGPASTWVPYTSARYGFEMSHPADWTERPSDRAWTEPLDGMSTATDGFESPDEQVYVSAWSLAVQPGTNLDAWIQTYCEGTTGPCNAIEDLTVQASTRTHAGVLVTFASDVQAFFISNDRIYVVALWRGDQDATTARYGGSRHLLEAFLSTMSLEG